ncbi:Ulp1 family isopeptidase [Chlamydia crocodili]|uniref:Ulp1 family isopeptidase n=1 Tax=Chlamydia TaxID=810 RepID=UPI002FC8CE9D
MANFLLSSPNTETGSIYTLYNPIPLPPKDQESRFIRGKTPITGPGSFDNASFLSKLARVLLAAILIIVTLGLILCFMSTQNLLDLNTHEICVDYLDYDYPPYFPYGYPTHQTTHYTPEPIITFATWDNSQILNQFLQLSERHTNLFVPTKTVIPTCFSIERLALQDMHMYDLNTQEPLNQPDPTQCRHNEISSYPHLQGRNCNNFRIFAYPMWHHPMANNEDEMITRMWATIQAGYAGISHWTLVIVNLDRREVLFFDSLAHFVTSDKIDPALKSIATRLGNHYLDANGMRAPFTVKKVINTPVQRDGSSCGIWISIFLEKYLENPDYTFPPMGYTQTQNFVQNYLDNLHEEPDNSNT